MKKYETVKCQICDNEKKTMEVVKVSKIRETIADNIKKQYPKLDSSGSICTSCLNTYRREHITDSLQLEKGALTALDTEVINSIKNEKMLVTKIYEKIDEKASKGDRVADKVAEFGGSWRFILIIFIIFAGWIILNSIVFIGKPIDSFPFALLSLMFSCLAAVQAPIIMMSQNRQEVKDRKRSEHEYQINLKAEIEIQNLNEKLNYLSDRISDLMEAQQIQTEMIEEFVEKHNESIIDLEINQDKATEEIISNQEKISKGA